MSLYDFSKSSYANEMSAKETQYRALVNQAERTRRLRGGPSKEEAQCYQKAADVCCEIMSLNVAQRAVHAQWQQRKRDCEECLEEILRVLMPVAKQKAAPVAPPPIPSDDHPPVLNTAAAEVKNAKPAAPAAPTATKSGFTTKNAIKDVPAETIEKWYKSQPNHKLDAVTGMADVKQRLLDDIANMGWEKTDAVLHISPIQGYVFYGPPGGGKTFLIEAFASEMMDRGFKFLKLVGGEIHASLVGVAEKTVQIAFQEAIDNSPCIIFIDEFEGVCADRSSPKTESNEKRLTNAFLEAWNTLKEYGKNVVFIGATNYPDMIDSAMLDRVRLVKAPLPGDEEREAYFKRSFGHFTLDLDFSYEEMVEATDNYSYRDLDRLRDSINGSLKPEVISQNRVETADGSLDQEQTDLAASQAILDGTVILDRELFYRKKKENPPSDKSKVKATLDAFEKRMGV